MKQVKDQRETQMMLFLLTNTAHDFREYFGVVSIIFTSWYPKYSPQNMAHLHTLPQKGLRVKEEWEAAAFQAAPFDNISP